VNGEMVFREGQLPDHGDRSLATSVVIGSESLAGGEAMSATAFGELFTELVDPALWLVTAAHGRDRSGLVATFVANASLVPDEPRVAVGIAKHHFTWGLIDRARAFALHLVDRARPEWVRRFGLRSGREADRFAGLAPDDGATGAPLLTDAVLWSECIVEAALDTGDRSVFLGRVTRCGRGRPGRPLTMSAMSKTLGASDRRELAGRLARDIAADAAAIREWRGHHRPS
jgi:flavin reductase (DIM6/NTAB) family NADH-FMN oxidoreductase RutF